MNLHGEDGIYLWCILIGVLGLLVYAFDLLVNSKLIFIATSIVGFAGFIFFLFHRISHFGE